MGEIFTAPCIEASVRVIVQSKRLHRQFINIRHTHTERASTVSNEDIIGSSLVQKETESINAK